TTVTDAHGGYLFPNLTAGTYQGEVPAASLPPGLAPTTHPILPGADFGNQTETYSVDGGSGGEKITARFRDNLAPPVDTDNPPPGALGAIGDRVWVDINGNGAQEPNEIGVPGVLVDLYGPGPDNLFGTGDDVLLATTSTNSTGNYIFDNLPAGAYVVK